MIDQPQLKLGLAQPKDLGLYPEQDDLGKGITCDICGEPWGEDWDGLMICQICQKGVINEQ